MSFEIARSRAVAYAGCRHRGSRAKACGQDFHDGRAGGRDQLFLNFSGVDRRASQQFERGGRGNRHHAVRAANRASANIQRRATKFVHAQRFGSYGAAHNVDDGVGRSHLVKVNVSRSTL